jgi:hypothetical protein
MLLRAEHPSRPGETAVEQPLVARHFFDGVVSYMHPAAPASTCRAGSAEIPPLFEVRPSGTDGAHRLSTVLRVGKLPVERVQFELSTEQLHDPLSEHVALTESGGALVVRFANHPEHGAIANYLRLDYPIDRIAGELPDADAAALYAADERHALLRERVDTELIGVARRPPGRMKRNLSAGKARLGRSRAGRSLSKGKRKFARSKTGIRLGKARASARRSLSSRRQKLGAKSISLYNRVADKKASLSRSRSRSKSGERKPSLAKRAAAKYTAKKAALKDSLSRSRSRSTSVGGGGRDRGLSSATAAPSGKTLSDLKSGGGDGTKPDSQTATSTKSSSSSSSRRGRSTTPKETASSQREPRSRRGRSQRGESGGSNSGGGGGQAPGSGGGGDVPPPLSQQPTQQDTFPQQQQQYSYQQQQQPPPYDPAYNDAAYYGRGGGGGGGGGYPVYMSPAASPGFVVAPGGFPAYSTSVPVAPPPGMTIPPGMQLVLQPSSMVLSTPANPPRGRAGATPVVIAQPGAPGATPLRPAPSAVSPVAPPEDEGEGEDGDVVDDDSELVDDEIIDGLGDTLVKEPRVHAGRMVNTFAERERIAAVIEAVAATECRDDPHAYRADIASALCS